MARKDDMFKSYIKHNIITEKYNLDLKNIPKKVEEAKEHNSLIISSIALILEGIDSKQIDKNIKDMITKHINSKGI